MTASRPPQARTVTCPQCQGPALYAPENRFRPFCGERCKQMDLGAWASESFRVPTSPNDPDGAPEGAALG